MHEFKIKVYTYFSRVIPIIRFLGETKHEICNGENKLHNSTHQHSACREKVTSLHVFLHSSLLMDSV